MLNWQTNAATDFTGGQADSDTPLITAMAELLPRPESFEARTPAGQRGINWRKLPPLKALRGFEAATRHQSIRAAADELCLTHPAVTHQVHLIEEALGVEMFAKDGRYFNSTETGRLFYPYVRKALETLLEGVDAVNQLALDRPLRVQAYVTASIRWLASRIPQFLLDHPDIQLVLNTCGSEWEFDESSADVGLVYLEVAPDPARFHWIELFDYTLYPVCSPDFLARLEGNPAVMNLLDLPLIAIHSETHNWEKWFDKAGVSFGETRPYVAVDTLAVALELALNGEGVALVNGPFAERDLAEGRLVRLVDHMVTCPGSWGLICSKDMAETETAKSFSSWITNSSTSISA